MWILRRWAPASIAFSTSSLTTDAGRSTTSPAAIWFARSGGRRLIVPIVGSSGGRRLCDPRLLNHDVAPETGRFLRPDVLPDFLVELLLRLPRPVFLEFLDHSGTGARNAEDGIIARGVQVDGDEHILLQPVGF